MGVYLKTLKIVCFFIVLLGMLPADSAWARVGHYRYPGWYGFGLGLGLGYGLGYGRYFPYYHPPYRPYYPYPPYYAYPPVVTVPAKPPVYIEQQQDAGRPDTEETQTNYWYYCRKPEGYYPHVKKCPDGWMQVVPQPPAQ